MKNWFATSVFEFQGWCNTLHAGEDDGANGFHFFMVGVDLTEEGLREYTLLEFSTISIQTTQLTVSFFASGHTDDIVKMLFQYLDMSRKVASQERLWREEQQIQDIKFRFRDKEKPISCARGVTALMQKYPLSEVLTGPTLMKEYDPVIIRQLRQYAV